MAGDLGMHVPTLERRGDYRLVVLGRTRDWPPGADDIAGYAVSTALGAVLYRDLGLDEARSLLDHLVAQRAEESCPRPRLSRRR